MKKLAILLVAVFSAMGATTYKVGPNETYRTPCAVSTLVVDGDTVEIAAGDYIDDTCRWAAGVTLRGVNGYANMIWTKGTSVRLTYGQAIWVLDAKNTGASTTVENISFKGARVVDRNGAGLRLIGATPVTIKNSKFTDNENGILANPGNYAVTIENSEFNMNGDGLGYAHNIYMGGIDKLLLRGSWLRGVRAGNVVKSRALKTVIEYNLIDSENSDASYEIDVSQGGEIVLVGNIVRQGPNSVNRHVVTAGLETPNHQSSKITLAHNTFISARAGTWSILGANVPCDAWNNILDGASMDLGTCRFPAAQGNKAGTGLVGTDWKPLGAAIGGAVAGSPVLPQFQYMAERSTAPRPTKEKMDAGAIDATGMSVVVTPPSGPVWALVDGTLPPGLTLQQNGLLTGIPAESGTFVFTVSVTLNEMTATKEFTLTVEAGAPPPTTALVITSPPVLPNAKTGETYSFQFQINAGDAA